MSNSEQSIPHPDRYKPASRVSNCILWAVVGASFVLPFVPLLAFFNINLWAMLRDNSDALQALAAIVAMTLGTWVSYMVWEGTKRLTKYQLLRANFDAWKDIDSFFLQHPVLANETGRITHPGESEEFHKKRRMAFLLLNPFYSYFYLAKGDLVDREMKDKFDASLRVLLDDPVIKRVAMKEVFVEGFSDYCRSVK